MKLIIGNKNYSSWSLRSWLLMRQLDIPFDEELVWLYEGEDEQARLRALSPSGKVPCLVDGDYVVWDTLAIAEYLAERFPTRGVWPADARLRAQARSVAAEMHSGFVDLRSAMPMNVRKRFENVPVSPAVRANIDRISTVWKEALAASGGPFLFGRFSAADAFYAPVVWRFRNYGVKLDAALEAYMDRMLALPAMQAWAEASAVEGHPMPAQDDLYPG